MKRRDFKTLAALAAIVALIASLAVELVKAHDAEASRNSSGTYAPPTGNPVVAGTVVTANWANSFVSDVGTELTNSLDRNGRGPMLAPILLPAGTASLPSVAWSLEPSAGLYRVGSHDFALRINSTTPQEWTDTAVTIGPAITANNSLTVANGITSNAPSTAGRNGLTTIGNGVGNGVQATGGTSSGYGLVGTGGTPNGVGIGGFGTGLGSGIEGTGGTTAGAGLKGTGGINGLGVSGQGTGTANGGYFQGGTSAGIGVEGVGGAGTTAVGGKFTNGTAATGGTRQDALSVTNGDISFVGVANPTSTTAVTNRLTPANMTKSYGKVTVTAGSPAINWGFNLSNSTSCATKNVTVNLASSMASSTNWVVLCDQQTGTGATVNQCLPASASSFTWSQFSGAQVDLCAGGANGSVTFMVIGNQ